MHAAPCTLTGKHTTACDPLPSPLPSDPARTTVRAALKIGAKLPASVAASCSRAVAPADPAGLPPVSLLKPHWQKPGVCRGVLLESIRAGSALLQVGAAQIRGQNCTSHPSIPVPVVKAALVHQNISGS